MRERQREEGKENQREIENRETGRHRDEEIARRRWRKEETKR